MSTINKAFSHDCIILDACCIINLFASQQMKAILQTIPKSLSVATYVKDYEALKIYADNSQKAFESIDLQPFIDAKLLRLVDIESEVEASTYINLAEKLDDGEAITGAIALNRNWAIATDDLACEKLFRSRAPNIALISTLDLVKYWAETNKAGQNTIIETLLNIRTRGRYEPYRNHPLHDWWQKYI